MMFHRRLSKGGFGHGILKENRGYTLVELVVVLAGLSILTTISLNGTSGNNGILSWKKRADIDGTKAILNATAADCLQKSRVSSSTTVDDTIISNEILESKGYKIDTTKTTCESFGIEPINETEALLFPMSFAIVSGKLTKSGKPTGTESIPYCKSWAGVLCSQGEGMEKLLRHLKEIQKRKDVCDAALATKKANKITAGPIEKWNPNATSGCPTRPPVDTSSATCTINGCLNNQVWLVGGVEYRSKADADAAEAAIAGQNCINALSEKTDPAKGGNPTLTASNVRPADCDKDYYFAKGKRFGDKTSWEIEMCSINIKQKQDINDTDYSAPSPINHCGNDRQFYFCEGKDRGNEQAYKACLIESETSQCGVWNDEKRVSGGDGKYKNPTKGMPPCGADFWVCNQEIVSKADYEEDCDSEPDPDCELIPHHGVCNFARRNHNLCIDWGTCKTKYNQW